MLIVLRGRGEKLQQRMGDTMLYFFVGNGEGGGGGESPEKKSY